MAAGFSTEGALTLRTEEECSCERRFLQTEFSSCSFLSELGRGIDCTEWSEAGTSATPYAGTHNANPTAHTKTRNQDRLFAMIASLLFRSK